jgi:hypothetical protein
MPFKQFKPFKWFIVPLGEGEDEGAFEFGPSPQSSQRERK